MTYHNVPAENLFEMGSEYGAKLHWSDEREWSAWRMDEVSYQLTQIEVGSSVLYLARDGEPRRVREPELRDEAGYNSV